MQEGRKAGDAQKRPRDRSQFLPSCIPAFLISSWVAANRHVLSREFEFGVRAHGTNRGSEFAGPQTDILRGARRKKMLVIRMDTDKTERRTKSRREDLRTGKFSTATNK